MMMSSPTLSHSTNSLTAFISELHFKAQVSVWDDTIQFGEVPYDSKQKDKHRASVQTEAGSFSDEFCNFYKKLV